MKIMKIIQILRPALAALLLLAAGAEAAVPRLINFQGKLSDSGGEPVASAVTMVFKIYTAASGGAPVWTETQTVTPDASGVYSVMLGAATPLDIRFSLPYWLGVTVGADSEMLPRYRMASSPYALNSSTAAWAEGADWPTITNKPDLTVQGNVFNGASQLVQLLGDGKLPILDGSNLTGLPTAFLADGAVTTAKLADGAVTDVKVSLSTAAISSGQFGDSRVAISTQALSGGTYNLAGRLVQLGADGSLPGLSGVNLTGLTKAQVGLGSVDNTSDADKPVSTAQLAALNLKASLAGAVFTGAVSAPNLSGTNTGDETALSIKTALGAATALADGYLASADWAAFNAKLAADGSGAALTGITKAQVGLGNVTNTSDAAKPVSTAQQAALDLKANLAGATFTGVIAASNLSGTNSGDETSATIKTKLGAATAAADGYLTAADWVGFNGKLSPTGNGSTLTGLTKAQVGLGSVDNTSDAAKPVSAAQQAELDLKADLAGAAFTGAISATNLSGTNTGDETAATIKTKLGAATAGADGYLTSVDWALFNGKLSPTGSGAALTGITAAQVGLGSVDNTSDAAKPVSTAQQTALDLKADLAGAAFTGAVSASNLSGTNTGDQTNITGNAGTVTNGVYTTGSYANPSWLTSLAASKIDLSTVTAELAGIQLALSTAVYTVGDQTIGGVKTFSSPIAGDITGNAATADAAVRAANIAGGAAGSLPYQTAADTTGLLAAGLAGQVLYSNGAAAPSWGALTAGDVYKASTQTFTGLNTFTSTITAKGFANLSQSIVLGSVTTFAADGSGVVLMTFNGTGNIATITGCSSGAVGQGQRVTFVVSAWMVGGISFADTIPAAAAADTMLLNGAAGTWTPPASAAALGAAITLLCTTVNTATPPAETFVKLWVEVGRSLSGV